MIALWIIGGILLLFAILLNCPIIAEIKYLGAIFEIKVKYIGFIVYPPKKKPDGEEKLKSPEAEVSPKEAVSSGIKSSKKTVKAVQKDISKKSTHGKKAKHKEGKNDKGDLLEKIKAVKVILESSKKGLRRLVKGIRICDINLDFAVADEDAYNAAINYGIVNTAVFNVISFLRTFFTVSIEKINIICRFNSSQSNYDGSCKVKLRPITAILAAGSIYFHYLANTKKYKKEKEKSDSIKNIERAEVNGASY
ncbi:MAG: DUF2953 domain-containing protein [Oscillospiraceae bacterium]|nr:DUF2953 domain-containing protein [Oscillospiraceae bacterium]